MGDGGEGLKKNSFHCKITHKIQIPEDYQRQPQDFIDLGFKTLKTNFDTI